MRLGEMYFTFGVLTLSGFAELSPISSKAVNSGETTSRCRNCAQQLLCFFSARFCF